MLLSAAAFAALIRHTYELMSLSPTRPLQSQRDCNDRIGLGINQQIVSLIGWKHNPTDMTTSSYVYIA
jgi:hypothetical protein